MRIIGAILAALLCTAIGAWAELCPTCRDLMFTQEIGKCGGCGGMTSSGAFKLCTACSTKLGQCQHCRAALATKTNKAEMNLAERLKRIVPPGWEVTTNAGTSVVTVTRNEFIAPSNISISPVPSLPAFGEGSQHDAETRGVRVWFRVDPVGICSETEYLQRQILNSNLWEQLRPLGKKIEQIPPTPRVKPSFLSRTPRNAEEQSWLDEYIQVRKQLAVLPTHHSSTNAFNVLFLKGHPGATITSAPILEEIANARKAIERILVPFQAQN